MAYLAVISFPSAFCFVLLCILFFFFFLFFVMYGSIKLTSKIS